MALAIHNTYAYLFKQGKYKNLPLLVFYVLTILLSGFRIFFCIFTFEYAIDENIFVILMMPTMKTNIGINQWWTLSELAMRVNLSLKISDQ